MTDDEVNGHPPAIDEMAAGDETDSHVTADEMDEQRKQNTAYEYLCRLEEAKLWIEACINEELPTTTELESNFQNGVVLAKLGHYFAPKKVPLKRIFDIEQTRYQNSGLVFRHTDNVVQFFGACEDVGLPQIFYPDTSDVYDRKNMPKLIFCLHALSLYLHKLGKAPQIQSLLGKVEFTEEEISAMRAELEKYGIQMPAFGKIGGILANEMPVDEAELHAAVIAINESLDKGHPDETLTALNNPMAHLSHIEQSNAEPYQATLAEAKRVKTEQATSQMNGESTDEQDVYDMLLTKDEIQSHVNAVNIVEVLKKVDQALEANDSKELMELLQSQYLGLRNVKQENAPSYLGKLSTQRQVEANNSGNVLTKVQIQSAIDEANVECDFTYIKKKSVDRVNSALTTRNKDELYAALGDPAAKYPEVKGSATALYFEEFKNIRDEKGVDLLYEEVCGGVKVMTAVANINEAAVSADSSLLLASLNDPAAHIQEVKEESLLAYHKELQSAREAKSENDCPFLFHADIQEIIDNVNDIVEAEQAKQDVVKQLNSALAIADEEQCYQLLVDPQAQLRDVIEPNQSHYYQTLKRAQSQKEGGELSWEEIQNIVDTCNEEAATNLKECVAAKAVNDCLISDSPASELEDPLRNPELAIQSEIKPENLGRYKDDLNKRRTDNNDSPWMHVQFTSADGSPTDFYYNTADSLYSWSLPEESQANSALLNKKEIQNVIEGSTEKIARQQHFVVNEEKIVKLQSHLRAAKARKDFVNRLEYLKQQESSVLKIQKVTREFLKRKANEERQKYIMENEDKIIKLQAGTRMMIQRKKYKDRLAFFLLNEDKVVKIQTAWRTKRTRENYQSLMHDENPPLKVVRKYMYLLDQNDVDYSEEMEQSKQRNAVVSQIRSNQLLEKDLQAMDIKIGLLVKNRITLEEVLQYEGKLSKHKDLSSYSLQGGLTSLNKESRERLNAYQHLFYHLQTNPIYLARLIFEMPQQASNKFIESVILTLYNYASNPREEYLILKLFATSLQQEILKTIQNPADIVTGNPLAVKMAVDFHRNARGHSYLREMLNPLVTALLADADTKINTNPIEAYKAWVNQTESESGIKSELPYDVTNEEALKHEEVQKRMDASIQQLRQWSDKFLELILTSLDQIPYGMRYVSKVLYNTLREKFPEVQEKEILKVIGNVLYYRYINATIAAPDAYGVIDVENVEKPLTPDQRRNLGSIAKILQFAASNKGFGGDSQHLAGLNSYIKSAHEKFKAYFLRACEVEEPDVHFNMDQYSDATSITKPQINISLMELINTHAKMLEYEQKIAPEESDVVHELLVDLGQVPTLSEITGVQYRDETGKDEEVKLTLAPKHEGPVDDKSELRNLLTSTKLMAVAVARFQPGETIVKCCDSPTTPEQEEQHSQLMDVQEQVDARAEDKGAEITRASIKQKDERKLSLDIKKGRVKEHMEKLAAAEMLNPENDYQSLVNLIAQDIRNQSKYRRQRRQDLNKLRSTMENLQSKRKVFETQIDSYKVYVQACLNNLTLDRSRDRASKLSNRSRASVISISGEDKPEKEKKRKSKPPKKQVVKYSAAKLHERGILVEIEDVATDQFKSITFEITSTENSGEFSCSAKFHGIIESETHKLKFQDLLQLQYEGVAEMKMFDRAKVNVNLLIFLLNKKFYITSK